MKNKVRNMLEYAVTYTNMLNEKLITDFHSFVVFICVLAVSLVIINVCLYLCFGIFVMAGFLAVCELIILLLAMFILNSF